MLGLRRERVNSPQWEGYHDNTLLYTDRSATTIQQPHQYPPPNHQYRTPQKPPLVSSKQSKQGGEARSYLPSQTSYPGNSYGSYDNVNNRVNNVNNRVNTKRKNYDATPSRSNSDAAQYSRKYVSFHLYLCSHHILSCLLSIV